MQEELVRVLAHEDEERIRAMETSLRLHWIPAVTRREEGDTFVLLVPRQTEDEAREIVSNAA